MANRIAKKMTVTRVSYGLCELVDGAMTYIEQPTLILKGIRSKDFVRKLLTKKHGVDANVSIKDMDAGEHRFSMSLEDFIRAADVDVEEAAEKGSAADAVASEPEPDAEAESAVVPADSSDKDTPYSENTNDDNSGDGDKDDFLW